MPLDWYGFPLCFRTSISPLLLLQLGKATRYAVRFVLLGGFLKGMFVDVVFHEDKSPQFVPGTKL